jgi:hypothetical protein
VIGMAGWVSTDMGAGTEPGKGSCVGRAYGGTCAGGTEMLCVSWFSGCESSDRQL